MCIQEQKMPGKEEKGMERVFGDQRRKVGNVRLAKEQEVTVPLTMQKAVFSDHCLIELPLI